MDVRLLSFYAACLVLSLGTYIEALQVIEIPQTESSTHSTKDVDLILSKSTSRNGTVTDKYTSSSEESNSKEHDQNKKSKSSESSENSSSDETAHKKIRKRSLDSNQDTTNIIGEQVNYTSVAKQNNDDDEDVIIADATTVSDVEEHILNNKIASASTSEVSVNSEASTMEAVTLEKSTLSVPESETTVTNSEPVINVNESDSEINATETELGLPTTETELETSTTESESEPGTTTTESEFPVSTIAIETDRITIMEETTTPDELSTTASDKVPSEEDDDVDIAKNDTMDQSMSSKENTSETWMDATLIKVNKLSDQIRIVLLQYRKLGAVVIPGLNIFPEPMKLQDLKKSFSIGTIDMKNMLAYGLSNFTIEHVNTDVDRMQVYVALKMRRIVILGNYTLKTFWSRAAGPCNITLLDVDSEGVAEIETTTDGHLEATDSEMDMSTKNMLVDFKNMGFMGSMFQGAVGAVGDAIFDSIKPQILDRVNLILRSDVNKKLKDFSVKFVNKISPVQLAFSEGRRYVREHGYDPYNIGDHSFLIGGLMHINITDFWVDGLSKFYRVGNLTISMDSGVFEVGVHAITQKLTGRFKWSGETFGIVKSGKTNFTVDHLQVRALVKQSLDIRRKPQLDKLDLELGWVKITMDSPLTLNMMIEGIVNTFPRLIRHIIVDTLEEPLKEKIQEILDKVNVESIVNENLPRLDSFGL